MTTSDPNNINNGHHDKNGGNGNQSNRGAEPKSSGLPSGFLDDRLLTQMANEMFKAAPEFSQAAEHFAASLDGTIPNSSSAQLPGASAMPGANAVPGVNGLPGLSDLTLPGFPTGSTNSGANQAANAILPAQFPTQQPLPGMFTALPGSITPGAFGLPSDFDPQRQLQTNGSGVALPRTPGFPSEADFRQLPVGSGGGFGNGLNGLPGLPGTSSVPVLPGIDGTNAGIANFPGAALAAPESVANLPQGTIPGGFNLGDFSSVPGFSFLNEIRPLVAFASGGQATGGQPTALPTSSNAQFNSMAPAGSLLDQTRAVPRIDVFPSGAPTQQGGALNDLKLVPSQFDVEAIRRDFPILQEIVNGHKLVWLDNAATTQKPQSVIDRLSYFYAHENSNVHRAAHELAARSTDAYERARDSVRRFLNASSTNEIVFVRGATEGINLVAQTWGRQNIQKDDEIVITHLEHHANIVPWQMLCSEKGAHLRVAPVDDHGQIILEQYERLLNPRTRFVSITQVSNALGTVTPIKPMIDSAHRYGARVLVDGAQAVSHMQVDVQAYDCDFYVFSGHKVFAPTGIGVVYGKSSLLETMQPWQGGGNMIKDVTFERTQYQNAPLRFEAGTGSIADAVGLGAAIEYLERIGMANVSRHEHDLLVYGTEGLKRIPGLHLIGTAADKAGVLSFVLDGFQTEEVSSALNQRGIAVRAGHHCAQPILRRFNQESTVRPSLALYNTCEDIDALIEAVWDLKQGRNPGPL